METPKTELRGLKVTIMGLGINGGGLASALYFASRGAEVCVTDLRDEQILAPSIAALKSYPVRYVLGRHELADFTDADLVIKNPAVRPDNQFLAAARKVETDISIFVRQCPAHLIAVTGSKGKSSTVSAIHHILGRCGKRSFLGGNITVSPLTFLEELSAEDYVVLELSSWQLGDLRGQKLLKPECAVLTHIVPDHLDRYGTMERYLADKRLIYADQDATDWTICEHDAWGESFAAETRARVLRYGVGLGPDTAGGRLDDSGSGWAMLPGPDGSLQHHQLLPDTLLVPGRHNRLNCLAAALAAWTTGLTPHQIREAVADFPGVPHRLEVFSRQDGVSWCNDSAATVPEAVEAAVSAFDVPVILITGGTDKVLDFEPAARACQKAKQVILLAGTGSDKLRALLDKRGTAYLGPFDNLAAALTQARSAAASGDIVVLSPGCTSFGMFKNEFDRGNSFKAGVLAMYASATR